MKIRKIALKLEIPKSTVHEIVHDTLVYGKVSARWVPKMLTEVHKLQSIEYSQRLLLRCQQDNGDEDTTHIGVGPSGDFRAKNNLIGNLITGDEIWNHLNTPDTKRDSMTWKHPSSPVTKKFKVQRSAAKVMATMFWDANGVILSDTLSQETTLATNLKRVTDEWDVTKDIVVLLSNVPDEVMSNAIVLNGWEELSCFGHSLNSVVSEALNTVAEWVRLHKKMNDASSYFYENIKASDALAAVQQQHNLPTKRLKQEKPNLWTSTFAMMKRMVEQYEAVNTVLCFLGKDTMCLCDDEVELIKDIIQILNPFQAAVEELCTENYTCVSKLIPIATLLQQVTAASISPDDAGTQAGLKSALISKMQQHFANLENNPLLATATLLDPRFKQHAFTDTEALEAAQERLLLDTQRVVKTSDSTDGKASATSTGSSASLWGMFDKKIVNAKALKTDVSEADNETRRFFKEVNILRTANPFQWWKLNEVQFPHLKVLATKFLCVPATAVNSHRLFFKEGIEFSSGRDMIRPTQLNNMLFLNQNLNL
ncbi:zinc finger BED domain-containing protein 4 [Elysia marginata]|uniref:Zinc finger BED domain-containing protein 4 n=1 Tax=Elysia marginata TaxID=1093978 RepID=A0AAV4HVA1_9GAST|nr:zinc finger BED domain-containing protein 4 [Elysia marginata]